MKVLKKIRARRADRKQAANGLETEVTAARAAAAAGVLDKAIFRGKGSGGLQRTAASSSSSLGAIVPPSVTWTMSDEEEEEEESVASTANCTHSMDTPHATANLKHSRQMQQQREAKNKHHLSMDASELAKIKLVMEELKEIHQEELAEKDDEIAEVKATLKETEHELAQTVVAMSRKEDELQNREVALLDTEMKLQESKKQLVVVSSCLMEHQEKLYETEEELNNLRNVVNIGKEVVAGFFSSF